MTSADSVAPIASGLAGDPAAGESQDADAAEHQLRIPFAIALERRRSQVVAAAVRLDDELRRRPVEVHLEAGDARVHERPRQSMPIADLEDALLELAARELVADAGFSE